MECLVENVSVEKLMAVDSLVWANQMRMSLREGVEFNLDGRPYLMDLVNNGKRVVNVKKGSQTGLTTTMFIDGLHSCYFRRFSQNILYMMPTVKQVEALSKISFDPILDNNGWLKRRVSTNTVSVKELNGRSIVFTGAQAHKVGESSTKDSPNLRSIPCDMVIRDEVDLMDEDMVDLSRQRLNASDFRLEVNFASPTYPGYGIDAMYEGSDKCMWRIECRGCGKRTCLGESFPDSIKERCGVWYRSCVHCGQEVFVSDGQWVSAYPDREEAGYWIDGFMNPKADVSGYMRRYMTSEGTARAEFMRSILGIATVESDHQLSDKDVLDVCGTDMMRLSSTVETVMGVDVGEPMYCVVGVRTGRDAYEIIYASSVSDFGQLHEVAKRFNVHFAVLDAMPDIHASRQFAQGETYAVYRCHYSEQMPGGPVFDREKGTVKCNRNEWCDKVYDAFSSHKIQIPARCQTVMEYARQMTKTAKTLIRNEDTGLTKPRWVKIGDDHFFHATLYFLLGASQSSPRKVDGERFERFKRCKSSFRI